MTDRKQEQIEQSIVLHLLDGAAPRRHSCLELERTMRHIEPLALRQALGDLERAGVLEIESGNIWASGCAWHLDALGLIAI